MEIEKNDMVMVYDGGGTVPHCKYTGRFGDLTAYWQEIVSDAVYLFRLGESEECDWLVDAADHIGYEWTGRAHGSLADALATLAVQRWLEQWLVAE